MLAIDSETTGIDLHHGARPFLVSMCREGEEPYYWEVDVDPMTRAPQWDKKQLLEIRDDIYSADWLVGQNIKFDYKALFLLFRDHHIQFKPPWEKTYDTLIAGHLLCSNQKHDLTSMGIQYLGDDISQYEARLKKAVISAGARCKREYPDWCRADKNNPKTPSVRQSKWGHDMWLPRAYARHSSLEAKHPWWTVCSDYACHDPLTTLYLWLEMEAEIKSRGLWRIFLERMKLPLIAMDMEMPVAGGDIKGVGVNGRRCQEMIRNYSTESRNLEQICVNIAESLGYELTMPKSGTSKSLQSFCFGEDLLVCNECGCSQPLAKKAACINCESKTLSTVYMDYLGLPMLEGHKIGTSGVPSLESKVLEEYISGLPPKSKQLLFVKSLAAKRKVDTAVTYLKGYKRFWQPVAAGGNGAALEDYFYYLHPSLNITGTDTLRWSCNNPNTQNISDKEDFNLRYAFGPLPGREWYSMDGQNLELRIPAYEAGEEDMIWVFEHPDEPPYYGSYHLLILDLLYPEEFRSRGKESPKYKRVKSGNFAVLYGCQEKKADQTYGIVGAFGLIRNRFPKIAELADKQKKLANKYGYVTTVPDKVVDPEHGYPIVCSRSESGYVLPTVPLNYHIQSTAMWWTAISMVSCYNKLKKWRNAGLDWRMALQVHDEIVFDTSVVSKRDIWRIAELKSLMEASGERIGVKTPVSVTRHKDNWSEGDDITKELGQHKRPVKGYNVIHPN